MGGAFVGVADDASAVYWNPAGLAGGAYFSLVLDGNTAEAMPDERAGAGSRTGWLLALRPRRWGCPTTGSRPARCVRRQRPSRDIRTLESLVTQHVGVTLVQSLTDRIAVGAHA